MDSPLSDSLYTSDSRRAGTPLAYRRVRLNEVPTLIDNEHWLRDAIADCPELVIGPCRQAGLTDDQWYFWASEFRTGDGRCDVLLVSSEGRVAIVEVKLSPNAHIRRRVLAQLLDYMVHLPGRLRSDPVPLPSDGGEPVADLDEVLDSLSDGDALLIIATDEADPRLARLTRGLAGDNLTRGWDLAVVDLALFKSVTDDGQLLRDDQILIVPTLRNIVVAEPRQFVRVIVEGETPRARVAVERVTSAAPVSSSGWSEDSFFEYLAERAPASVVDLANAIRALSQEEREEPITLALGGSQSGSISVRRRGSSLLVIYGYGAITIYRGGLTAALGDRLGREYQERIERAVPQRVREMSLLRLNPQESSQVAGEIRRILEETVQSADEEDLRVYSR